MKYIDSMHSIDFDRYNELWVIGGEYVLNMFKPFMDELHLTRLHEIYDCDQKLDVEKLIEGMELMDCRKGRENFDLVFEVYRRVEKKGKVETYTIVRIDGKENAYANFNCDEYFTLLKVLQRIDKKGKKYKIMTLLEAKEFILNN